MNNRVPGPSLRTVSTVVLTAALTVLAADLMIQRVLPLPPRIPEVDDGVADYERSDPRIVVIGSSHARSFGPAADWLAEQHHGVRDMVIVPVEWGSFTSFNWVLQHRLKPLIEERGPDAQRKRSRLARAILVTTHFDLCPNSESANLPARAWTDRDFIADVERHGLTDYNRTYLQRRVSVAFHYSILFYDRGYSRIGNTLRKLLGGQKPDQVEPERVDPDSETVRQGRRTLELLAECHDEVEKGALVEMLDYFASQHVETTVVDFPIMPALISDLAKNTTLKNYTDYMAKLSRDRGFRVVDVTLGTPLANEDFATDLDHVRPSGNRKLDAWLLNGPMRFLADPVAQGGQP